MKRNSEDRILHGHGDKSGLDLGKSVQFNTYSHLKTCSTINKVFNILS